MSGKRAKRIRRLAQQATNPLLSEKSYQIEAVEKDIIVTRVDSKGRLYEKAIRTPGGGTVTLVNSLRKTIKMFKKGIKSIEVKKDD